MAYEKFGEIASHPARPSRSVSHVCSSVSIALPVTAWRDVASVIGIRKAGPGREMTACGRLLSPGSSGRAITKLVNSTLVQYAACRLLRRTAGQMSQFDSDYSVGDQASPLFFSQVRLSLCCCLPVDKNTTNDIYPARAFAITNNLTTSSPTYPNQTLDSTYPLPSHRTRRSLKNIPRTP